MLYISTDDGKNKLTCHIILLCNNLKQMCLKLVVGTSLYISKIQTLYPVQYHYLSLRSHRFYIIQHLLYQFSHHTTPLR